MKPFLALKVLHFLMPQHLLLSDHSGRLVLWDFRFGGGFAVATCLMKIDKSKR